MQNKQKGTQNAECFDLLQLHVWKTAVLHGNDPLSILKQPFEVALRIKLPKIVAYSNPHYME